MRMFLLGWLVVGVLCWGTSLACAQQASTAEEVFGASKLYDVVYEATKGKIFILKKVRISGVRQIANESFMIFLPSAGDEQSKAFVRAERIHAIFLEGAFTQESVSEKEPAF